MAHMASSAITAPRRRNTPSGARRHERAVFDCTAAASAMIPPPQGGRRLVQAGQCYPEIPHCALGGLSQPAGPEQKLIVARKTEIKLHRRVGHEPFCLAVVRHQGRTMTDRIVWTSDMDLRA